MFTKLKEMFSISINKDNRIIKEVEKCDLCGSSHFKSIKEVPAQEWDPVKNYYNDNPEPNPFNDLPNKFELKSCNNCGLVFINPRITDEVVNRFYDEYLSGKYKGYIHNYDTEFREEVFKGYFNFLNDYCEYSTKYSSKFLDIGCATGAFLKVANQVGFESYGIEVSPLVGGKAKEFGEVLIGDVVDSLKKLPDSFFDLVTSIDSIEHFKSPMSFIKALSPKIKTGGILFIETPNSEAGFDEMSRHFFLFSKETMSKLLTCNGFEILYLDTVGNGYNPHDGELQNRFLKVVARKL